MWDGQTIVSHQQEEIAAKQQIGWLVFAMWKKVLNYIREW